MYQRLSAASFILGLFFFTIVHGSNDQFSSGWVPEKGSINQSNKIVVHFNLPPSEDQAKAIGRSLTHMFEADPKLQIKFVLHGKILDELKTSNISPWMQTFLDQARSQGAQFLICNNTLLTLKIKMKDLYKVTSADMVQAGILEISRLQQQGFSYIRYF